MRGPVTITTRRPALYETADLLGVSRARAVELRALAAELAGRNGAQPSRKVRKATAHRVSRKVRRS
jgi:hypothetical protein